jgi:peroxiredoxin-like protein
MENEYFYETEVGWMGKRHGYLQSPGLPILEVAPPPEFQGQGHIWTPEHLLVASVNSCYMATFVAMAEYSSLELVSFSSSAVGKLEKAERGYVMTEITLRPKLVIKHEYDTERAQRLLEKAEKNCFVSNSIKGSVRLVPEIQFEEICACA